MSKAAVRLGLPLLCLLALTACSGDSTAGSGSEVSLDGASPATETGGVEQPLPPEDGSPVISVASLPVGGQSEGSPGDQCVRVSWILSSTENTIPGGLSVKITGVAFAPDRYVQADHGCAGPACVGLTLSSAELRCDLPIRPTETTATELSESDEVKMSLKGRVLCTDYDANPCKTFAATVLGSPQTIPVPLPVSPEGPTDSTTGSGGETTPEATSTSTGG